LESCGQISRSRILEWIDGSGRAKQPAYILDRLPTTANRQPASV